MQNFERNNIYIDSSGGVNFYKSGTTSNIELQKSAEIHDFDATWKCFLQFENTSRRRGEKLCDFIRRWEENMTMVQEAGCEYSDTLLACKLLQRANLDEMDARNIISKFVYSESDMLCSMLFLLDKYSPEKSESVKSQSTVGKIDNYKLIKEESKDDLSNGSSSDTFEETKVYPEVEIKEEPLEISQTGINVDLTELDIDHEEITEKKIRKPRKRKRQDNTQKASSPEQQENGIQKDAGGNVNNAKVKTEDGNAGKRTRKKGLKSQCEVCGKTIAVKFMDRHHIKCLNRLQGGAANKSEERKKIERVQCEYCGKDYPCQRRLKEHYLNCPNLDQEQRDAKGYACPSNRRITCKICNKTFARKYNYQCHLSLHTGQKIYKCDICPASFAHTSFLESHKMRHEKGKRHHCHVCNRAFHATTGLKRHIMRLHTKERPYQCPHCNYNTVDNHHLSRHIRTHTGETPYKCNLCGKFYKDKNSVKRHMKAHHGYCDENYIVRCDVPVEKSVES